MSIDDRLSSWADFRKQIETSEDPLQDTWDFWQSSPFIPYNNKIDPYHYKSWPTPWSIIVDNHYDDFTRVIMIAWTLKLTKRFRDSKITIQTLVDKHNSTQYNVVLVDEEWVINYSDNGPISAKSMPISFYLENLIELETPR
jgi:hypothetical protein